MKKDSLKQKYLVYKVRQSKDAEAYGNLYDFYVERIYRFIFFKVNSQEIAEDLTSEVFLKTWEYINKTDKKINNLNALFYKVARNSVIDHYRSKKIESYDSDEDLMEKIEEKRNFADEVETKLEMESLQKHLTKLKDIYREVLILRFVEEFSISEIAELMEKSSGNVRVLLHRATEALKNLAGENQ